MSLIFFFSFYCSADHRDLHSFPTRRSSDLGSRSSGYPLLDLFAHRLPGGERNHALHEHAGKVDGVRVELAGFGEPLDLCDGDRKSTRLNSSHPSISYAVFCLKKKKKKKEQN